MLLTKQLLEQDFDVRHFVPVSYMSETKVLNNFILKVGSEELIEYCLSILLLEVLMNLGLLIVIDDGSHDDLVCLVRN
jgi:hypothetical protein